MLKMLKLRGKYLYGTAHYKNQKYHWKKYLIFTVSRQFNEKTSPRNDSSPKRQCPECEYSPTIHRQMFKCKRGIGLS